MKLSRRQLVQAAAALGAVGCRSRSARPNIVFILADDLGYADVGCFGQKDFATPHIDRLATQGLKLTQGYSSSPVCSATRTALITGRYQYRLPIGLEEPLTPASPKTIGMPATEPTLPSLLKKSGYGTALVGKWHLGSLPEFGPLKSGYDTFFGITGGATDYFKHGPTAAGGAWNQLHEQEQPIERAGYLTNLLGLRAVQTINTFAGTKQPFLLSLHFTAPHWPWEGPDDEAESKRIKDLFHRDGGSQKTFMQMVQNLDLNIGRVLAALDSHHLTDNTIVVFTSDNGGERFSNTWPFSGMKTELLEGGIRVPTIVRWPGQIESNSVSTQVMASMDWAPTILAAAGVAPVHPFDGQNLLPLMLGKAQVQPRKLYWRYRTGSQRALRDADWKYLRIAGNEFLFDVTADPRERANQKERQPEVFERLKADWEAWNETMLPELARPAMHVNTGANLADHYGVTNPER